jgi:hypothetical protein
MISLFFIQDYRHFNGNQIIIASKYLNSFQTAPYYANSNHRFVLCNGTRGAIILMGCSPIKFLSLKDLTGILLQAAMLFYVNKDNNYVEIICRLENILKLFRIDVVGYLS